MKKDSAIEPKFKSPSKELSVLLPSGFVFRLRAMKVVSVDGTVSNWFSFRYMLEKKNIS
jgi:hypothetical protein